MALEYRDSLVARAHRSVPAAGADDAGRHTLAAVIDFSRNLGLAAIPETIGGIVSVDRLHRSRLRHARSAVYYGSCWEFLGPAA